MTTEIALLIAQAVVNYGPDIGLALAKLFKAGATIDDAISALENVPTTQQILDEAKARHDFPKPPTAGSSGQ